MKTNTLVSRRLLLFSSSLAGDDQHAKRPFYKDESLWLAFASAMAAIITYLVVNAILSCIRRRRGGAGADGPAPRSGDKPPLDTACLAQLNAFPIFIFSELPEPAAAGDKQCCSVCLAEYEADDEVRVMPKCRHVFHRECVDRWLLTRSAFCPNCRDRVVEKVASDPMDGCSGSGVGSGVGSGGVMVVSTGDAVVGGVILSRSIISVM